MAERPGRGLGLAARLRATLAARDARSLSLAEEERAWLDMALRERTALLEALAEFGRAVGHFEVKASGDAVVWRWADRHARFEITEDPTEVALTGSHLVGTHRLVLNRSLVKWSWRYDPPPGGRIEKLLFDAGLEHILWRGFDLRPDPGAPEHPDAVDAARQPPAGGLAPAKRRML